MLLHRSSWLAVVLAAASCAAYEEPKCQLGSDCASGICNLNGTCAPDESTSSSSSGSGGGNTGGGGSTSSSTSGSSTTTSGGATCLPNNDGSITRDEVPLAASLHATFKVGDGASYDTAGKTNTDGSHTWDLTVPFSGDHTLVLDTLPLDNNLWFAADYVKSLPAPKSFYAAKLSDTADLLGVFEITDASLLLHGVASSTKSSTYTEMFYDPPVQVLSFPITENKTWDTLSAVSGTLQGITIGGIYNEEYTSTVDAHGTLKTPYADFQVLRVNTKLLRYLNGVWMTKYTHTFVTECFGTVGTIVSQDNELSSDFTSTAEIWRFSK